MPVVKDKLMVKKIYKPRRNDETNTFQKPREIRFRTITGQHWEAEVLK